MRTFSQFLNTFDTRRRRKEVKFHSMSSADVDHVNLGEDGICQFVVDGCIFSLRREIARRSDYLQSLLRFHEGDDPTPLDMNPLEFCYVLEYLYSGKRIYPKLPLHIIPQFIQNLDYFCLIPSKDDFIPGVRGYENGSSYVISRIDYPLTWRVEMESEFDLETSYEAYITLLLNKIKSPFETLYDQFARPHPTRCVDWYYQRLILDENIKGGSEFPDHQDEEDGPNIFIVEYYDFHPQERLMSRRQRNGRIDTVKIPESEELPHAFTLVGTQNYERVDMKVLSLPYGYVFPDDRSVLGFEAGLYEIPENVAMADHAHFQRICEKKIHRKSPYQKWYDLRQDLLETTSKMDGKHLVTDRTLAFIRNAKNDPSKYNV